VSLPWYVEEKGGRPSKGALSIAQIKAALPVTRLLRHFGGAEPEQEYSDWQAYRCPFHQDNSPSASVNLKLNRFRCHVCDVGGDVIDVVSQHLDMTMKDAMEWISRTLL